MVCCYWFLVVELASGDKTVISKLETHATLSREGSESELSIECVFEPHSVLDYNLFDEDDNTILLLVYLFLCLL